MTRPSWDSYFMGLAVLASTRGTCDRAQVGCVLVDAQRNIVATGYNGSPSGQPHCDDVGHLMVNGHCVRTLHAEWNALLRAGPRARGAVCYVTHHPCHICTKLLVAAGVVRVVYGAGYRVDPLAAELLAAAGVLVQVVE